MNDRQLLSFMAVAEAGSFSKAAKERYVSTSALVQQIDLLESEIGFELFFRTKQGITLTQGGRGFYDASQKILGIYKEAVENGARENSSVLRVPIAPDSIPDFLLKTIQDLKTEHPEIEVNTVMCQFWDQLSALRKCVIDFAVMPEPKSNALNGLSCLPLADDTLSFCMSPLNPLASKKRIKISDLRGQVITYGKYDFLRYSYEGLLRGSGAILKNLPFEYNLKVKIDTMLGNELIPIHGRWGSAHEQLLKVVPSDIPCNRATLVCRKNSEESIRLLHQYLIKNISES